MTLSQSERDNINSILVKLEWITSHQASADEDKRASDIISYMTSCMKSDIPNIDSETALNCYLFALEEIPSRIIILIVGEVLKGRIEGISKVFSPTAPQIAEICDVLHSVAIRTIKYYNRILNAPEEKARNVISFEKMKLLADASKTMLKESKLELKSGITEKEINEIKSMLTN